MIGKLLRRVADAIDPPTYDATVATAHLAGPTMFEQDEAASLERSSHAMSMLDDDVLGYVLMRVVRKQDFAYVDLHLQAEDDFWPALSATARLLATAGDRVG